WFATPSWKCFHSSRFDHRKLTRDQDFGLLIQPARPLVAGIDRLLDRARRPAVANARNARDSGTFPPVAQLFEQSVNGQATGNRDQCRGRTLALFARENASQSDRVAVECGHT